MGTGSSSAVGSFALKDTQAQALIAKPLHATAEGVLILCDGTKDAFSSRHLRRIASNLVTKGNFIVLSLNLSVGGEEDDVLAQNMAEIQDGVRELLASGAHRLGVLGLGRGANLALRCVSSSSSPAPGSISPESAAADAAATSKPEASNFSFTACVIVCPGPEVEPDMCTRIEVPTLCVLAGQDACLPKASALSLAQHLKGAAQPTSLRNYPGQERGFVDSADTPAGAAAVDDARKWFAEHLGLKEDWRIDRVLRQAGKTVPVEADWWSNASGSGRASGEGKEDDNEASDEKASDGPSGNGFVNVGAANWALARAKWVAPTGPRPPLPPRVGYDALVDGFADPRRTFELPGRVSLPNMTAVLNDIWEIEGVS